MNDRQYVYRLKDPNSGQYLKDIKIAEGSTEFILDDEPTIYRSIEALSVMYHKIDIVKNYLERLGNMVEDYAEYTQLKQDLIIDRKIELEKLIEQFDKLEMEILEVNPLLDYTGNITNDIMIELYQARAENIFKQKFASVIESNEIETRRFKEMYNAFKIWEHLPNRNSHSYIIFGGKPIDHHMKQSINRSGLSAILDSLGLQYFSFTEEEFTGFAALSIEDFNLLRVSNSDCIVSYINTDRAIELRKKIVDDLLSSKNR